MIDFAQRTSFLPPRRTLAGVTEEQEPSRVQTMHVFRDLPTDPATADAQDGAVVDGDEQKEHTQFAGILPSRLPATQGKRQAASRAASAASTAPKTQGNSIDAAEQQAHEAAMLRQQTLFNWRIEERSELQREQGILDTLMMAQLKHEDEMTKEWMKLI